MTAVAEHVTSCISPQALTTGSIPGFIDVVMNLNSPALLEDNLIWQAKTAGKRIIFYGDDTWVRLFPKHFVEYDGTTSFFVSDFTEVSAKTRGVVKYGGIFYSLLTKHRKSLFNQ